MYSLNSTSQVLFKCKCKAAGFVTQCKQSRSHTLLSFAPSAFNCIKHPEMLLKALKKHGKLS